MLFKEKHAKKATDTVNSAKGVVKRKVHHYLDQIDSAGHIDDYFVDFFNLTRKDNAPDIFYAFLTKEGEIVVSTIKMAAESYDKVILSKKKLSEIERCHITAFYMELLYVGLIDNKLSNRLNSLPRRVKDDIRELIKENLINRPFIGLKAIENAGIKL